MSKTPPPSLRRQSAEQSRDNRGVKRVAMGTIATIKTGQRHQIPRRRNPIQTGSQPF